MITDSRHDLATRLAHLERAIAFADGRISDEIVEPGRQLLRAEGKRPEPAVTVSTVCLVGSATASKWELFETLASIPPELSVTEIEDPNAPFAALSWQGDVSSLLATFGVPSGNVLRLPPQSADPSGMNGDAIVVDVPPTSSLPPRAEVTDSLDRVVDLLVWVAGRRRVAAARRDAFIEMVAEHPDVAVVVVDEIDRVPPERVDERVGELRRALARAGAEDVPVLPVSVETGRGLDMLGGMVERAVRTRRDLAARLGGEISRIAVRLLAACGHDAPALDTATARQFLDDVVEAAEIDPVVRAVGRAYRARGRAATGWLPRAPSAVPRLNPPSPERVSVGRSRIDVAVRRLAEGVGRDGPRSRTDRFREVASTAAAGLYESLYPVMSRLGTGLPPDQTWWRAVPYLRWASLASIAVGVLLFALVPGAGWPQASLLVALGFVGLLSAVGGAALATGQASTRAMQSARLWLTAVVEQEARERVLVPVGQEVEAWRACQSAAREARGSAVG